VVAWIEAMDCFMGVKLIERTAINKPTSTNSSQSAIRRVDEFLIRFPPLRQL
jgi:hypothetical protein